MKILQEELKNLAEKFEGKYFIDHIWLDDFARNHNLCGLDGFSFDQKKIMAACGCLLVSSHGDIPSSKKPGYSEIIFNDTEQENVMEEEKVFGRINEEGSVDLLHYETGEAVTRYEGCWPLNSELSGAYEHPAGIELSVEDAEELGIEIEA
jgi:hypothetical protein